MTIDNTPWNSGASDVRHSITSVKVNGRGTGLRTSWTIHRAPWGGVHVTARGSRNLVSGVVGVSAFPQSRQALSEKRGFLVIYEIIASIYVTAIAAKISIGRGDLIDVYRARLPTKVVFSERCERNEAVSIGSTRLHREVRPVILTTHRKTISGDAIPTRIYGQVLEPISDPAMVSGHTVLTVITLTRWSGARAETVWIGGGSGRTSAVEESSVFPQVTPSPFPTFWPDYVWSR